MVFFAGVSFGFNLLYAMYNCLLGILNLSFWFIAMCALYGIFATMRFSAVLCHRRKHRLPSADTEIFVMKLSGILLTVLSFVLAAINYISLSQNLATKYDKVIMISIAAYTFYKITITIIRAVKQRENPSLLLKTILNISLGEVAVSLLSLQRSMLVSFGETEDKTAHLMNFITGTAVFLFELGLGIFMIIKSIRKEHGSCQNLKL